MAADERLVTLLRLLDLSAAFDCVDHSMLLDRLRSAVCLSDSVLDWVLSFLTDKTQQIAYSGQLSAVKPVLHKSAKIRTEPAVVTSTAELDLVVARHGVNLHQYADITQVYVRTSAGDAKAAVGRLAECLVDIETWLKPEGQQTTAEPHQDSGRLCGWVLPSSWPKSTSQKCQGVETYKRLRDGSWPRCRHRLSAVRCLHRWPPCVAVAIIPTTAVPTARQIYVNRTRKVAGPGVHFVSPGLL